jgi:hypothetical protein
MKTLLNLNAFVLSFCDEETLEQRIERYREMGLSEEEIAKLTLQLPSGYKPGDRLFTQKDLTKARQDERRKVEGNLKYRRDVQLVDDDDDDDVDDEPVTSKQRRQKQTKTLQPQAGQLNIQELLQAPEAQEFLTSLVQNATADLQAKLSKAEEEAKQAREAIEADRKKAFEKRKGELLADLPEDVHTLLVGNTIEEIEASYKTVKAFVDKTLQEAQASKAAAEAVKNKTVFFKSQDGTEFASAAEMMAHPDHAKYFEEFKASKR